MAQQSNDFLYLFRGGADPKQMSPEQMQQNMNKWFAWMGELRSKGKFKAGEPLGDDGQVLSGKKGSVVTDGPFVEGKEEVGGYLIVSAHDLNEAVALAKEIGRASCRERVY